MNDNGKRLFCPAEGTRSVKMTGEAGKDAVSAQCDSCGVVYLFPATTQTIDQVRALFSRSDLLPAITPAEGTMADG
jgi:hypothetical protein